jgi:putative FmdB family regulatory protein
MPIYEYACQDCGHEFETLQKMSEDPLRVCPACQAPSLRRLVSAAGFQLKGTGWYATDFRGGGKDKAKKEKGDDSPSSSAPADAKAEPSPAPST